MTGDTAKLFVAFAASLGVGWTVLETVLAGDLWTALILGWVAWGFVWIILLASTFTVTRRKR